MTHFTTYIYIYIIGTSQRHSHNIENQNKLSPSKLAVHHIRS